MAAAGLRPPAAHPRAARTDRRQGAADGDATGRRMSRASHVQALSRKFAVIKKRTANVHRTGGWRSSRHLVLQRNIFVYMFFKIRPALNTRHVYVYTFTKSIKQLYKIHTGLKKCIDNDQMFSCHTSCFHGVGGG